MPADRDREVRKSSGNVFADLGVAQADDMLLKSDIVVELRRLMASRGLGPSATAMLVDVDEAELVKLLAGGFRATSIERLMRMLTAFDQEVRITSRPKAKVGVAAISYTPSGA